MVNHGSRTATSLAYWDTFYADRRSAAVPTRPSAFAEWVHRQLSGPSAVIELGFGTARDSFWLAGQGHTLRGFDGAASAVDLANTHAEAHGLPARFSRLDLTHTDAVHEAAGATRTDAAADLVYARFLLHSLPEQGRVNVLDFARLALRPGGRLYVEFRTGKDAEATHLFGDDHFRAYLDPDEVATTIRSLGGEVLQLEQGHGLAPYKSEDPHVARVVACWGEAA